MSSAGDSGLPEASNGHSNSVNDAQGVEEGEPVVERTSINESIKSASEIPPEASSGAGGREGESERERLADGKDLNGEVQGDEVQEKGQDKEAGQDNQTEGQDTQPKGQDKQTEVQDTQTAGQDTHTAGQDTQTEEWADILGNGQLMKKVLRKGEGLSTRPTPQSRVKVRTRGLLESGKAIDRHSGVVFTVGDGDVIQAWDLAVTLMERGEMAQVKTNARFAYGSIGRSPDIPPDASITYELELLEVMEPVNLAEISEKDLLALMDKKRIRGNELFMRKEFGLAVESYNKGLKMMDGYIEERDLQASGVPAAIQDMQIRFWNNMAAAHIKVECYKEVLESCEKVLEREPDNVKALFRSGKVLSLKGEMDEAVRRLQRAAEQNREEKAIQVELQRAVAKRKATHQQEVEMYKRMMEGSSKTTKRREITKPPPTDTWGPLPYLAIAAAVATIGIGLAYIFTQRH